MKLFNANFRLYSKIKLTFRETNLRSIPECREYALNYKSNDFDKFGLVQGVGVSSDDGGLIGGWSWERRVFYALYWFIEVYLLLVFKIFIHRKRHDCLDMLSIGMLIHCKCYIICNIGHHGREGIQVIPSLAWKAATAFMQKTSTGISGIFISGIACSGPIYLSVEMENVSPVSILIILWWVR